MHETEQRQMQIVGLPPRIAPLSSSEMEDTSRAVADRLRRAAGLPQNDEIPEVVATLLRHPRLYEKHVELGTALLAEGVLAPRHRELVILRTGWLCGAPFEWGEHVEIARRNGITSEEINLVTVGSQADAWSHVERTLLRAAEELHADAMIGDATWSELAAFLNEMQLIELVYVIGNYTKVAYLQNALRIRLGSRNRGLTAR